MNINKSINISEPKKQAQNFTEKVKLDSGEIVPTLDIEKLDR